MLVLFLVRVFIVLIILIIFNFILTVHIVSLHETVVSAALPANNETVWTANKSAIRKFTRTLVIIAAIWAQRVQTLG